MQHDCRGPSSGTHSTASVSLAKHPILHLKLLVNTNMLPNSAMHGFNLASRAS